MNPLHNSEQFLRDTQFRLEHHHRQASYARLLPPAPWRRRLASAFRRVAEWLEPTPTSTPSPRSLTLQETR